MSTSNFRNFFNTSSTDGTLNQILNTFINNRLNGTVNTTESNISYVAIYDMYETEKSILIYVDLPGIDPSTIQVDFFNNKVDISAMRLPLISESINRENRNNNEYNNSSLNRGINDNYESNNNSDTVDTITLSSENTSHDISEVTSDDDSSSIDDNTEYLEHHKEIVYGKYTKRITLPFSIIKKESIKVTSKFGVLIIEINKEMEERNRFRIPVVFEN